MEGVKTKSYGVNVFFYPFLIHVLIKKNTCNLYYKIFIKVRDIYLVGYRQYDEFPA